MIILRYENLQFSEMTYSSESSDSSDASTSEDFESEDFKLSLSSSKLSIVFVRIKTEVEGFAMFDMTNISIKN